MIDTILFDLDGTLINTNELIIESFKYVFDKHGLDVNEEYLSFIGPTLEESFSKFSDDDKYIKFLISEYVEYNINVHDERVSIYPNVYEVLEELSLKYKLGIVSSKKRNTVIQGLELFDIAKFFDCIIASEDCAKHKPDPEGILKAMDLLNANNAIYVGDNDNDIYAAHNANIKAIGVLWSYKKDLLISSNPDYLINDIKEIIKIVG